MNSHSNESETPKGETPQGVHPETRAAVESDASSDTRAILETVAGDANDELTGHHYDGIQEYDNPLPGWWKWLFVATILFAFPYFAYYHSGAAGRTLSDRYASAAARNARLLMAEIGELDGDAATLAKFANDETGIRVGESVYKSNCQTCHGIEGQGLVGPNLQDDFYKHIRTIDDIYDVVTKGAAAGAMPAWQTRLDQNERVLVSAYVAHLRGTGDGTKGPEGQRIEPWPEPVDEPSVGEPIKGVDDDVIEDAEENEPAGPGQANAAAEAASTD